MYIQRLKCKRWVGKCVLVSEVVSLHSEVEMHEVGGEMCPV